MRPPIFIDVFMQPLRDNKVAQVAFAAFCFLMLLDILLGYASAVKSKTVKSAKMREGLWHKTGEMGIIAVGDVLDGMMLGGIDMPFTAPVTTAMIVYLAINEAVSCMENIVKLDPELGDKRFFRVLMATLSDASDRTGSAQGACTWSMTCTKATKRRAQMPNLSAAIAAMDKACRIWSVGYDQGNRWDIRNGGETDCSALVIWALKQGGFDTGGATYTGNLSVNLTRRGWLRLPANLGVLQPGDILLNDTHHVCMVISGHGHSAIIAQASIDERGKASGGRAGDQTGYETNERRVYSYRHGWDCILRYKGAGVTAAPVKQASKPSGGIVVDGYWGAATTLALQKHFGTTADGVVSSQEVANRGILKACTGGWQWVSHPQGSQLITKMQRALGVPADGIMGKQTVNALEKHYGFNADGYLGAPSNTVKKMQQAINADKF